MSRGAGQRLVAGRSHSRYDPVIGRRMIGSVRLLRLGLFGHQASATLPVLLSHRRRYTSPSPVARLAQVVNGRAAMPQGPKARDAAGSSDCVGRCPVVGSGFQLPGWIAVKPLLLGKAATIAGRRRLPAHGHARAPRARCATVRPQALRKARSGGHDKRRPAPTPSYNAWAAKAPSLTCLR